MCMTNVVQPQTESRLLLKFTSAATEEICEYRFQILPGQWNGSNVVKHNDAGQLNNTVLGTVKYVDAIYYHQLNEVNELF